jgi:hypothetical protein
MSVRVERSDRIVTVILSRPEARNAASPTRSMRSRTDQRRCANYIVKSDRCERPREPVTGFAVEIVTPLSYATMSRNPRPSISTTLHPAHC